MHRRHEAVTSAPPRMAADGGAVESAARQIRGDLPEGKTSARVASDSIDARRLGLFQGVIDAAHR